MQNALAKYNPDFIAAFARDTLGVNNPAHLAEIQGVYHDWYFNRERAKLHIAENAKDDEVDLALVINVGGTQDQPNNIYVSLNKSDMRFIKRRQRLHNDHLRSLSPLEVATLTHNENFGTSEDGFRHGEYMIRTSNSMYAESAFGHIQEIINRVSYASHHDLSRQIARVADGFWNAEYDYFEEGKTEFFEPLRQHANVVERQSIRSAFRELLSHLDQNALRILFRARLTNDFYYSWLAGRADCDSFKLLPRVNDEAVRYRQDAAFAFPIFLSAMVHNASFANEIDKGQPLIETIQSYLSESAKNWGDVKAPEISTETVKWFLGKKPYLVDGMRCKVNPRIYHMASDARWLNALPREWRPRNHIEYAAFDKLHMNMGDFATLTERSREELFREIVGALTKPKGLPQIEGKDDQGRPALKTFFKVAQPVQQAAVANTGDNSSRIEVTSNVKDFVRRMIQQIVLPEFYARLLQANVSITKLYGDHDTWYKSDPFDRRNMTGAIGKNLFRDLSVIKILTTSHKWHAQAARLENRTGFTDKPLIWHPLIEPTIAPNGVRMKAMTSTLELREMGHQMRNCIGGYTYNCAVQNSHVLVLSDEDGTWITNLELKETGCDPRQVQMIQHECHGNERAVPLSAADAANWLVSQINEGHIPCDWETIDETRTEYRKDALMIAIGFDPRSTTARDRAFEAWQGTLPNFIIDTDRLTFLKRTGVLDAIDAQVAEIVATQSEEVHFDDFQRPDASFG